MASKADAASAASAPRVMRELRPAAKVPVMAVSTLEISRCEALPITLSVSSSFQAGSTKIVPVKFSASCVIVSLPAVLSSPTRTVPAPSMASTVKVSPPRGGQRAIALNGNRACERAALGIVSAAKKQRGIRFDGNTNFVGAGGLQKF